MSTSDIRKKLALLFYDVDTFLGINNEGQLVLSAGKEYTDRAQGGGPIWNGQDSVLFVNERLAFQDERAAQYRTLRQTGALSYSKIKRMFDEHQSAWPERLWNEDGHYSYELPLIQGGINYLEQLLGNKKYQRDKFLYETFWYWDSKYLAGDALTSVITVRSYATDNVTITPYQDLYVSVQFGSYKVIDHAQKGVGKTLICPVNALNDTETYFYAAERLSDIGDISGLKPGLVDIAAGIKLRRLKIGDSDPEYENPNLQTLELGNNRLLQTIDARGSINLGTGNQKSVDASGCTNVEELYFDRTAITGVVLPVGGILRKLHLPATVTNITIRNHKNISEFVVAGYTNVNALRIENSDDSSAVSSLALLNAVPAGCHVRLIGFTWEAQNAAAIEDILDTLDTMQGIDIDGQGRDVSVSSCTGTVSGTIHTAALTGTQVASYEARYPHITFDADAVTSYRYYHDEDGALLKTVECHDGVPQEAGPSTPTKANSTDGHYSYTFAGWTKTQGNTTVDADALDEVIADRHIYAVYTATVRTYTVTWKNSDSTTLETDTNVPWGTTPTYDGATPTYNGQTATGWTPTPGPITGNTVYTATYVPTYTVRYYNGSTLLDTQTVQQGGNATYTGSTPVYSGTGDPNDYEFTGFSPSPTNVQSNLDCYAQFSFTGVVDSISDTLAQVVANCTAGTVSGYSIGDTKKINMGTMGNMSIQLIAKNADPLADETGNANTTWLMYYQLPDSHRMNPARATDPNDSSVYQEGTGTIGGWDKSEMKQYILDTVVPNLPQEIRNAVKTVKKYTRIYNTSSTAVNNVETEETFWLASRREMFGAISNAETQGPIYSDAFPDNASRVKSKVGASSASWWWLRSASGNSHFSNVSSDGSNNNYGANYTGGVVVGFCL